MHPSEKGERWRFLTELVESGKVTPVIDKTYPLSKVGEAIEYLHADRLAKGRHHRLICSAGDHHYVYVDKAPH